jgi:hypothetical protein
MKRVFLAALLAASCGGTTGSHLVSFQALAGGPADATGSALTFSTQPPSGVTYQVRLTRTRLLVGAVYLNQSVPASGSAATGCVLPGIYVAEAFGPVTLDLLSPVLQPFPAFGEGTETPARTAEVWLTSGDVNAPVDPTVILDVAGTATATQSGNSFPFQGTVTISANRAIPPVNPALPGSNPICKQRIVSPIFVDLTPTDGGTLTVRIDPRAMFQTVDFATLQPASPGSTTLLIPDTNAGAGQSLFKALVSTAPYQFTWSP